MYVCICVLTYVQVQGPEEGDRSGVLGSCELPNMGNLGPVEEQYVLGSL